MNNFYELCKHPHYCSYLYISPSIFEKEQINKMNNEIGKILDNDYKNFKPSDEEKHYLIPEDNINDEKMIKIIKKVRDSEKNILEEQYYKIEYNEINDLLFNCFHFIIVPILSTLGAFIIYYALLWVIASIIVLFLFLLSLML